MPYGQNAKIGLAFQNSHGTVAEVDSMYSMPFLSESITPDVPELLSGNMEGRFDEGEAYSGPRNVAGTLRTEAQPITVGVLLKALMGDPTTVNSNNIYTHTFKPRTADFDTNVTGNPLTMYKNLADGGQVPLYQDLVFTRLMFDLSNGELLTVDADATGGVVAAKTTSQNIGVAVGRKWPWDVTSVELGGAADVDFEALEIIVDEQASARWTLQNTRDPARVKRDARRQVRVNGTVKFRDQTEYDIFLADTLQKLKITLTGTTEIESGYFDTVQFEFPSFKYLTYPLDFPDEAEKIVRFEGKGDYNVGSGHSVVITVINTQASF
jgi:hypothetical protein